MTCAFIGEIRDFGFNYEPEGWALCDGRLLDCNEHEDLYSLIGMTYGGEGREKFAIPDLRGRVPIGTDAQHFPFGLRSGNEINPPSWKYLPSHKHNLMGTIAEANTDDPDGGMLANARSNTYAKPDSSPPPVLNTSLTSGSISPNEGSSEPIENRQPYLVTNYCIALQGIYPTRP